MGSAGKHVASLDAGEVVFDGALGRVTRVTADTLPILKNLSIKRLRLAPGAIREPHWHANANELAYCLSGKALVCVLDNGSAVSRFLVTAGQMFHVASGALHHIENVGGTDAEFVIAFRHERPEDFSLHAAFGAMTDAVLGNAYGLPASAFAAIPRSTRAAYILRRQGEPAIPVQAAYGDPHRFDVEAQSPPVASSIGTARLARSQLWPALADIAMYSLRVDRTGMREPHWHPETAEMGYVATGRARMTVLDPDGSTDTYDLGPGDVYFIPRAYPHHIEVLGDDAFHFLIFFDRPMPGDIGYRVSASALSRPVLAATLGIAPEALPDLPFTASDPLLVSRLNRDE